MEAVDEERYEQIVRLLENNGIVFQVMEVNREKTVLSFDELYIDLSKRLVVRGNDQIYLTLIEFDILFFLASYPGYVFTHRQIYEAVWRSEYVCDSGNITAHIGHIRKKLEPDPRNPIYIQTVRGVGYKFAK